MGEPGKKVTGLAAFEAGLMCMNGGDQEVGVLLSLPSSGEVFVEVHRVHFVVVAELVAETKRGSEDRELFRRLVASLGLGLG
jgi:hypothetical protein